MTKLLREIFNNNFQRMRIKERLKINFSSLTLISCLQSLKRKGTMNAENRRERSMKEMKIFVVAGKGRE